MGGTMILVVILLAFAIFAFVQAGKSMNQIQERQSALEQTKDYVIYNSRDDSLTVKKRDPEIAKLLEIHHYRKTEYGYTPEKLIYTWASVGGVTTGGTHKTGGFYARDRGNTGKAKLMYCKEHTASRKICVPVHKIFLSADLAKQAEKSNIKDYLDGTAIVVMQKAEQNDAAVLLMQIGHKDAAFNMVDSANIAAAPTIEKCVDIVNWLSKAEQSKTTDKKKK